MTTIIPTSIVGTYYQKNIDDSDLEKLKTHKITLLREPNNEFDKHAIKCMIGDLCMGYLPRDIAGKLAPMIDEGMASIDIKWVGPSYFDIKIYITSDPSVTRSTSTEDLESMIQSFIKSCEADTVTIVRDRFEDLKSKHNSVWFLLNRYEPILAAVSHKNIPVIQLLIELGFKTSGNHYGAIRLAVREHWNQVFDLLIDQGVSAAGRAHILVDAYLSSNAAVLDQLKSEKPDAKVLGQYLLESVESDDDALTDFLLLFRLTKQDKNEALLQAASIGSKRSLETLLRLNFSHQVIYEARIAAIENNQMHCFLKLMRRNISTYNANAYIELAVFKKRIDFASIIYRMNKKSVNLARLISFLVRQSQFHFEAEDELIRLIKHDADAVVMSNAISKVRAYPTIEQLVRIFQIHPLMIIAHQNQPTTIRHCLEIFELLKSSGSWFGYPELKIRYGRYGSSNLSQLDLPQSILDKLTKWNITTVIDLMACPEEVLRDLIGLNRVELNEVEFGLEEFESHLESFPDYKLKRMRRLAASKIRNVEDNLGIPRNVGADYLGLCIQCLHNIAGESDAKTINSNLDNIPELDRLTDTLDKLGCSR